MDAHDRYSTCCSFLSRRIETFLFHSIQMIQKLLKIPASSALKVCSQGIKRLQIGHFGIPTIHSRVNAVHSGQQEYLFYQLCQRADSRFPTQELNCMQKKTRFMQI